MRSAYSAYRHQRGQRPFTHHWRNIMAKRKPKPKAEADEVDEVDEVEIDAEELDESGDEDEATEKPVKSKQQEVTFGVADLATHLSKKLGKEISTRDLRTQIRRMAREDNPRVDREVVPGNRQRYDWPKGLKDPEVRAIIKAVTDGELEAGKQEALQKLKDQKAAKKAKDGGTKAKSKGKGKKGKPAPEPEDDDDDDVIDVDDDD
jgi:hypothetical protein